LAPVLGKKPGDRVPLATLNTASEIANRNNNPDAQSQKAWLARPENKGKDASDYTLWKAKNSPSAMMSGGINLTPEATAMAANLYAQTGQLPAGFSRAPQVTSQVINKAATANPDIASNKAAYKANTSALNKVVGMRNAVEAYEKTASKNLDLFIEQAKNVPDTGIPILNAPTRALAEQMGSEKVSAYNTARQVALTEIARVVNNPNLTGVLSDSARKEIESFNPNSATLGQTLRIAQVLRQDMKNRHDSLVEQEKSIRNDLNGGKQPQPQGGGTEIHYKIVNGQLVAQ
jgi:hypothetical protein